MAPVIGSKLGKGKALIPYYLNATRIADDRAN